jgi:hypothetical protein
MPLRVYDNNAWQSPTSIRIYNDSEWKTASAGYVYDMGMWRVVFPDPIIPSIVFTDTDAGRDPDDGLFYVGASVKVTNGSGQIFAELFLGSTPSGTPIQTKNVSAFFVDGNDRYYEPYFYSSSFTNNQNYCIRVTATSITENQSVLSSGAIYLGVPTVSIISFSVPSTSSFSVSWLSQNQYRWLVTIRPQSGFGMGYVSAEDEFGNPMFTVGSQTSHSATISPPLLGNTGYILTVEVENNNFSAVEDTETFTSPNDPTSSIQITDGSIVQTCSSLGLSWTAQNTVYGYAKIYTADFPDAIPTYTEITSKRFYWTSQRTHTFTGLESGRQYLLEIIGYNINDIAGQPDNELTETLPPSANAPTNLAATSDYWGKNASFTWTAATANCTTVSGYRLEYKLSTSSTWTNLSNSIASSATSFSVGSEFDSIFTPGRTYNFRLYAKTSIYGEGPPASVNLTMNNNPYAVQITGTNTIETSSTSTLTAQLVNAAYENLSRSGFVISWSFIAGLPPGAAGSSVSPTSSTTNSSGQATTTFSSSTNSGTGTVYATTSGISTFGGGQRTMTVNLRVGLTPTLSTARTNFGYDVTHSNYNSLYSYSGTVTNGGFNFDGVWNDGFYTIVIPPINTAFPVASRNALVSVTCTSGTWTAQPSATTQVTSSRTGYADASASVSNSPTGTLSFSYTWYFGNGDFAGNGQTLAITSAMRGRNMYCIVIATRTGGTQGFQAQSNTIAIPA